MSYLYTVLVYYCLSLLVSIFSTFRLLSMQTSDINYMYYRGSLISTIILIYLWLLLLSNRYYSCLSLSMSDISQIFLPRFTMFSFNFLKLRYSNVLHLVYFQQNTIFNCSTISSDSTESMPSCRHFGLLL